MSFDFLPSTQTNCLGLELEFCTPSEIIEKTCMEDLTINVVNELKEYFVVHMN